MTLEQVNQLLSVNFQTGELIWKYHPQRPDLIGCRAGCINNGYWRLRILGVEIYASQVVWFIYYGTWPKSTLDHADLNGLNDAIDNLREATKAQNVSNSELSVRNTSGYKGVSLCPTTRRWRASIRIDGREKNLGRYDSAEKAYQAYMNAAIAARGKEFVRA